MSISKYLFVDKNEVVVEYNKKEKANKGLSHIDSDGVHVLVGTESGMRTSQVCESGHLHLKFILVRHWEIEQHLAKFFFMEF